MHKGEGEQFKEAVKESTPQQAVLSRGTEPSGSLELKRVHGFNCN